MNGTREILFRGKRIRPDEATGIIEWVYGLYMTVYGTPNIELEDGRECDVDAETVGQYTGLTDTNGTKIFEGDILHIKTGDGWTCPKGTDIYYEVVFTDFNIQCNSTTEHIGFMANNKGSLKSIYYIVDRYGAEVVGNKYDNPELLKERKKQNNIDRTHNF